MKRHLGHILTALFFLAPDVFADPFASETPERLARMGAINSAMNAARAQGGRGFSAMGMAAMQMYNQSKFMEAAQENSERRREATAGESPKVPEISPLPSASPEASAEEAKQNSKQESISEAIGKKLAEETVRLKDEAEATRAQTETAQREQSIRGAKGHADAVIAALERGEINTLRNLVQQSRAFGQGIAKNPQKAEPPASNAPTPSPSSSHFGVSE